MEVMKILLFGYGEMGRTGLEFLLDAGDEVLAVVTHRDDPKEKRWFRSLADLSAERGVPVIYGEDLGRAGIADLVRGRGPDLLLSSYYRDMIPMTAIDAAPRGGLNLHGSLLPRLRGRAPTNWALVEGEERTGVTLHHMTARADAGDIVAQRGFPIGPRDTALDLFRRTVEETKLLLADVWPRVRDGSAPRIPQDESKATCRGRRTPEDGRIDWTLPARRIDGLVRAVTDPFPGAFTFLRGRKLMVWSGRPAAGGGPPGTVLGDGVVATGDGAYRIERWEIAGSAESPELSPGLRLGEARS
jgi:methionyl-tRNA formyltransferase